MLQSVCPTTACERALTPSQLRMADDHWTDSCYCAAVCLVSRTQIAKRKLAVLQRSVDRQNRPRWHNLVLKIVPQICRLEPDVICMQIGGNDVSSVSPKGVETALAIESLANEILDRSTCKALYIGKLLFRFKDRYTRTDSESQYHNTQSTLLTTS